MTRVATAASIAAMLGFSVSIMIEKHARGAITRSSVLDGLAAAGMTDDSLKNVAIVESPWMPVDYRKTAIYPEGVAVNAGNLNSRDTCSSVLATYTLQGDGKMGACCGIGMRMIPELNPCEADVDLGVVIAESEADLMKLLLRYLGPFKLLAWAAGKDPSIDWENKYAHHCQACIRLYKDERVSDVIAKYVDELEPVLAEAIALEEKFQTVIPRPGHFL